MSTAAALRDSPWERLPWTLPLALLLAALCLGGFARLLSLGRAPGTPPPLTIEAQIVTLPAPPVAAPTPPVERTPPLPEPEVVPTPRQVKPPPRRREPPREVPRAAEAPPQPTPPVQAPTPTTTAPVSAPPAPPAGGNMGARALYQPVPELPPELRRRKLDLVAVARFAVAADGSAQVQLVTATPDLQINRVLLDTLKKWRFFPAMQNGQPVASVIELRIPVSVQ